MQRVPEDVDADKFEDRLKQIEGVSCVHDIHIWSIGSNNGLCTAHVVVKDELMGSRVLEECRKVAEKMDLHHSTFQIEVEGVFDHLGEKFGALHGRKEECC
jgi:Co/Zn/Cd efflux system component